MITDDVSDESLKFVINTCKQFYENELESVVDIIETKEGFDLEVSGIEIGSYGIRSCEYLKWIYGTGLAEPRMTFIKNTLKNGIS
jgi:hypothetical protein